MNDNEIPNEAVLIKMFIDRYLPREEIIHRLPVSIPIGQFWPVLAETRKQRSIDLPLNSQDGKPFWFVLNSSIEAQCDSIAAMARRDRIFDGTAFDSMAEDAVIDEAVYSSIIEGAYTSRKEAAVFIRGHRDPGNKSEQMIRNNYDALTYVLEHLEETITEETIIRIARIVTKGTSETELSGYRSGPVYVNDPNGVVYTPPAAEKIPEMMGQLICFIQNNDIHPVLKACAAHFYLVYIHPFSDGNGRTARALSYMILLKSGYDFFRFFSISDIVAKEPGKYYRSMKNVEDSDRDMTYFIDSYSNMLTRGVQRMEEHLVRHVLSAEKLKVLAEHGTLNDRQLKGAKWLMESGQTSVTIEIWKKKYKVVTETARRDLLRLCENGLLTRTMEGRKAVFRITAY